MAITTGEARRCLFALIEQVNEDQEAVEILSKSGTAFLVSEEQWRSMVETAYLMRSPANAQALPESIAQTEAGDAEAYELLEP